MKKFFQSNYQHFVAIGLFLLIVFVYFKPQFEDMSLRQNDVKQYIGMANESYWFKDKTGQEQLWTNSMFGGMPTTQITLIHPGNFIGRAVMNFINWFPAPGGMVLLHLVCFYIMLLCFRVNRWLAILGAIAFAFASYEIVILEAGHNSKSLAVAFMAPVVGGFYMAYRYKQWLGIGLSALVMTLEISCNHLQVTYYLGILLLGLGIMELIRAIKTKAFKPFIFSSAGLLVAYLLAVAVNYGNISLTNEYAKHTIRGGNDLTMTPTGEKNVKSTKGGLDKDYITQWSYGKGESFTLISPYVKGGETAAFKDTPHAEIIDDMGLRSDDRRQLLNYPVYWGEQPFTSGPVYVGVIMVFLALLGMIFLKDPIKWPLLIVGILALVLSWGKNFMGFTEFWIDNVPGYNKFRTVTIILVLIELIVPLIAILFLDRLIKERETIQVQKKKLLIASAGFIVFLIAVKMVGLNDNYMSQAFDEKQLTSIETSLMTQIADADPQQIKASYGVDITNPQQLDDFISVQMEPYEEQLANAQMARKEVFHGSMNRSILFAVLAAGALALIFFTSMHVAIGLGVIGLLSVVDIMGVATNYLSSDEEYWMNAMEKKYPYSPESTDLDILRLETQQNEELNKKVEAAAAAKQKELSGSDMESRIKRRLIDSERFAALNANTNYRVFDYTGGFNSSQASYFHKSLGGYHGAKLRSIQNMIEFHIGNSNNAVFDILNVKYFIQGQQDPATGQMKKIARVNPTAMGPAWLVKELKVVDTRDDEIRSMGKIFRVTKAGAGELLVNGEPKAASEVRGFEEIKYVESGDTLDVPLSNGIRKGFKAIFVMDRNGETNLVPELTLEFDTTQSFRKLVEMEVTSEFDPSTDAFIAKENAGDIKQKSFSGEGNITMTSYSPMKIEYSFLSSEDQFSVFSEIYYPMGWTASIDGKAVDIHNVNYCLRGLNVPSGKHTIVFEYETDKYDKSNTISLGLSVLVLLFVGFGFWKQRKEDAESSSQKDTKEQ